MLSEGVPLMLREGDINPDSGQKPDPSLVDSITDQANLQAFIAVNKEQIVAQPNLRWEDLCGLPLEAIIFGVSERFNKKGKTKSKIVAFTIIKSSDSEVWLKMIDAELDVELRITRENIAANKLKCGDL